MQETPVFPVFATPSLDHSVSLDYLRSWSETQNLLFQHGVPFGLLTRGGDCFVDKVRCKLAQQFLDGTGTHLFFLDSDLGWDARKVLEFLQRPEPMLAGVYPKKADDMDWPVALEADGDTGKLITDQGLYLAQFAGGGFLCIRREVIATLAPLVPRFMDIEMGGVTADFPLLFESCVGADGWWQGEDVGFFRLAKKHGYDLWVDCDIHFKHRGSKVWEGRLSDHLDTFEKKAQIAVRQAKEPA